MNYKYLSAASVLILGAGCLALAKQQKSQQPNLQINMGNAANVTSSTANVESGSAAAKASHQALRHSDEIAKQGQKALDQKRYKEAESLFRKALAVQSENQRAWLLLAEACERQGKLEEALPAYHRIVDVQYRNVTGCDPIIMMRYVLALVRSNRYTEAVAVYDKAYHDATIIHDSEVLFPLRFTANNSDENRLQAAAHYVMGIKKPQSYEVAPDEMQKHLQTAIRFAPDWGRPHAALGHMLERSPLSSQAAAEVEYTKARQLGETVESDEQRLTRTIAELKRRHDAAHPGLVYKHRAMVQRQITPEDYARVVAKAQATMAEDLRRQAEAKKQLKTTVAQQAEDYKKAEEAAKVQNLIKPGL